MIEDELYAVFIFDHARTQEMVSDWYILNLDEKPEHISVFAGTKYDQLAKVGPQLLYTSVDSELYELGRHQIIELGEGVIFYTRAEFSDICQWATRLVAVQTKRGGALFRFYEPSIIDVIEEAFGKECWWGLLDLITMIENFNEGEWTSYKNTHVESSTDSLADAFITSDGLERLTHCREQKFYQSLAERYQQHIKSSARTDWVSIQCAYAKSFQFETHYLQESWVRAALLYGDHFYQHIKLQSLLNDLSYTSMRRWEMIEELLPTLSFQENSGMNYVY